MQPGNHRTGSRKNIKSPARLLCYGELIFFALVWPAKAAYILLVFFILFRDALAHSHPASVLSQPNRDPTLAAQFTHLDCAP